MNPSSTMPSWRSGNTHGFCVTGGHLPIASEPTPSPRLWVTAPGATPARLCEHTMRVFLPTLRTGTFYLAGIRNFLFGSDSLGGPQAAIGDWYRERIEVEQTIMHELIYRQHLEFAISLRGGAPPDNLTAGPRPRLSMRASRACASDRGGVTRRPSGSFPR